jgi:CxxC-x17-CxxC domain-containing protein
MGSFNRGGRFNNKRNFNNRGFGRRDEGRREMHKTVCADCGNNCEIPFIPRDNRPVYCNSCFAKHKPSDSRMNRGRDRTNRPSFDNNKVSEEQLKLINEKLDKISEILNQLLPKPKIKEKVESKKKSLIKKETPEEKPS